MRSSTLVAVSTKASGVAVVVSPLSFFAFCGSCSVDVTAKGTGD